MTIFDDERPEGVTLGRQRRGAVQKNAAAGTRGVSGGDTGGGLGPAKKGGTQEKNRGTTKKRGGATQERDEGGGKIPPQ